MNDPGVRPPGAILRSRPAYRAQTRTTMEAKDVRYLTDPDGNRVAVQIPLDFYRELLEAAEDLDDLRAYLEAKADPDQSTIPLEEAMRQIRAEETAGDGAAA